MESWRWRSYWKGERRLALTRWNNSAAAGAILQPTGFTPQPPAASNSEPCVVFVSSFILCQCPKTREVERRETCPKCRGPSGVWSADTQSRRVRGEEKSLWVVAPWFQHWGSVCFKKGPQFTSARHQRGQTKHWTHWLGPSKEWK